MKDTQKDKQFDDYRPQFMDMAAKLSYDNIDIG